MTSSQKISSQFMGLALSTAAVFSICSNPVSHIDVDEALKSSKSIAAMLTNTVSSIGHNIK